MAIYLLYNVQSFASSATTTPYAPKSIRGRKTEEEPFEKIIKETPMKPLKYLYLLIFVALSLSPAYAQSKERPPQKAKRQTNYYSIHETSAANNGTRATFSFSSSIGRSDAEQTCGRLNRDAKPLTKGICRVQGVTIAGIPDSYTVTVIVGGENDPKSVYDLVIQVIQRFNPNTDFVHQRR